MKTKRLEILENSLLKKESEFSRRLENHIQDVNRANGQPMNDKRNGHVTLNRWDRQNESLRRLQEGIQKTKDAIEREQGKIKDCEAVNIPEELQELLDEGKITQWRKHPNRFFVVGVEKARLILVEDGRVMHKYVSQIPKGVGQFEIFKEVFNHLNRTLNKRIADEKQNIQNGRLQ